MKRLLLAVLMFSIPAYAQQRPKVFVKPNPSGSTANVESEIAKRCHNVAVTEDKDKADYILDYSYANGANAFVVFNRNGDLVQRGGAFIFHKAIEKACKAMK